MPSIKAALQRELQEAGWHSRGYLPHFDAAEITQTVTFRLADSLPQTVLEDGRTNLRKAPRPKPIQFFGGELNTTSIKDTEVARFEMLPLPQWFNGRYFISMAHDTVSQHGL
ncbi:MAG TPA: hypothetical protein VF397_12080 [Pyrinomonadaceae bacterium]